MIKKKKCAAREETHERSSVTSVTAKKNSSA
jgi:hypothetical protein